MNTVLETTDMKQSYITEFDTAITSNALPTFFSLEARKEAINMFDQLGFPTKKNEEWRYTTTKPLQKQAYKIAFPTSATLQKEDISAFMVAGKEVELLVLENGQYNAHLSTLQPQQGLRITSLADASEDKLVQTHAGKHAIDDENSLLALNIALATDGVFVHVSKGLTIEKPIHIMHISNTQIESKGSFVRNLIVADDNSKVSIVESYHSIGEASSWVNAVTEVVAMTGAEVNCYKVQLEGGHALQYNFMQIHQEGQAKANVTTCTLGGKWVRNNLHFLLNKPGVESHMYGLYLVNESRLVDNHTFVDHAQPHCYSNEVYKGIVDDKATAVFNGKIMVRPDAQKTNAYQSSKNILLSNDASVNTKPQLEIFADDVKCSHGATTGQIDQEALFYLRSRGIGEDQGRAMLMHAFASDVLNNIDIEPLKHYLMHLLAEYFHQSED